MKCPNCGSRLSKNSMFCNKCGTQIDNLPEPGDQQPNGKKMKALMISFISLAVVLAIVVGVVIFVKNVDAAELKEAKDDYVPPAQAVEIDPNASDPSNDKIKFKYDSRSRIVSCTYTANEKTYDQKYTYDDSARKVEIETSYKKHPIFRKEIPYDRVPEQEKFVKVDGYYIRLDSAYTVISVIGDDSDTDDRDEDDGAKDTEAPPDTQPPAPPVDPVEEARSAYLEHLESNSQLFAHDKDAFRENHELISVTDINGDDIPELVYAKPAGTGNANVNLAIYTYSDGSMQQLYDGYLISIPGQGPIYSVFIGDDGSLYSVCSNAFNGSVIRYDISGYNVDPSTLAESSGVGSSDPSNVTYIVNGSQTDGMEYHEYAESVKDKSVKCLVRSINNNVGGTDAAMTYDEAIAELS